MRRFVPIVLLVALLGACSGGGGGDDDAASKAASPTTLPKSQAARFCAKSKAVDDEFSHIESLGGSGTPVGDDYVKAAAALDRLATGAPPKIKPDLKLVVKDMRHIGQVIAGVDLSDPSQLSDPAVAERLRKLDAEMPALNTEVNDASERIAEFLHKQCGVDIGGAGTTTTSTAPSSSSTTSTTAG